jgi:nucleoside 2-deoxyribosyltransferase
MTKDPTSLVAISSTVVDLAAHRQAAIDACLRVGVRPLVLESFPGSDQEPLSACLQIIDQADIYLGIFGFRYGYVPAGYDKSITELEYERAGQRGIPRLVFFMSDKHAIRVQDLEKGEGANKLKQLKEEIARTATVAFFSSPDELRLKIVESLLRYQTERPEPKKALLLIPFGSPEHEQIRQLLTELLENLGFTVVRFENIRAGATWANAVADAIRTSDLILADVTGANPNIMYELGYAHALKKPTVLLANSSESITQLPSDVQSYQILMYDAAQEAVLKTHLARVLRAYVGSIAS